MSAYYSGKKLFLAALVFSLLLLTLSVKAQAVPAMNLSAGVQLAINYEHYHYGHYWRQPGYQVFPGPPFPRNYISYRPRPFIYFRTVAPGCSRACTSRNNGVIKCKTECL